jgi:putative flippase GtrA
MFTPMHPLIARLVEQQATIRRVLRCLSVSFGTTVLSAVILVGLALGAGVAAGTANLIAVGCGIPPSYLGNRRWVWRRTGRGDVGREVVPFWAMSIAGLIASTWFVGHVGTFTAAWPATGRAIALPVASIGVFGVLWVLQFVVLDRVIFRAPRVDVAAASTTMRQTPVCGG